MKFSRRSFLRSAVAASAATPVLLGAGRLARAKARKLAVRLDQLPALKTVGGSTVAQLKEWKILFARVSETEVRAFHPYCTHRKCQVGYNAPSKRVDCSCHGSKFDLTGRVLNGPATENLPAYPCWLKGDRVIVQVPG